MSLRWSKMSCECGYKEPPLSTQSRSILETSAIVVRLKSSLCSCAQCSKGFSALLWLSRCLFDDATTRICPRVKYRYLIGINAELYCLKKKSFCSCVLRTCTVLFSKPETASRSSFCDVNVSMGQGFWYRSVFHWS